jgi:hypothetical protein
MHLFQVPSCALVEMPFNMPIDTDPQQQAAAPPLMLVGRSFLRYAA